MFYNLLFRYPITELVYKWKGTGSHSKNGDCIPLSLESSPGNNFLLVLTFAFSFTLLFLVGKHFALLTSFNTIFFGLT